MSQLEKELLLARAKQAMDSSGAIDNARVHDALINLSSCLMKVIRHLDELDDLRKNVEGFCQRDKMLFISAFLKD